MDLEKTQNEENKNEQLDNISEANIFSELSGELDFGVKKKEKVEVVKDKLYYIKLAGKVMIYINIAFGSILFLFYLFLSVQNSSLFYSKSYLEPFCFILLSDEDKNTGEYCSSVSSLLVDYDNKINSLTKDTSKKLSGLIGDLYTIENFVNSKEINFLVDNKNSRLLVLNMLNDFDNLKNDFTGMDKKKISCNDIKVYKDSTMQVICDVNSSSWEVSSGFGDGIVGFSGDRKEGTIDGSSITLAASFLNYIEKNPQYNFQLIEKQKDFKADSIVGDETSYVKKTTIKFKLKYNNIKNNISL